MDDTAAEVDLTALSDPVLLDLKHDLSVALSTAPDADTMRELARVEREVARRVSGTTWRVAWP
jgi:hypothetical protein